MYLAKGLLWECSNKKMHHHQNLGEAAAMSGMLPPYEAMAMYEQPKPRFIFKMPRVVPDQKSKYDSDELFRRLSRETEVRYTGYRERAIDERRMRFVNDCRKGYAELSFVTSGTNVQLYFNVHHNPYAQDQECDFERERGKVHLRSHFIMNGVCVRFRGWVDLDRLDGAATLEFDEGRAQQEDAQLREQIESYNQRMTESKRIYPVPHTPPRTTFAVVVLEPYRVDRWGGRDSSIAKSLNNRFLKSPSLPVD